jgi:transposase
MSKRKKYLKEFKLDAVSLVVEQRYSRTEAAKSLAINSNMLGRWIKEAESDDGHSFRGNGKMSPDQEQMRALQKRVKRLEMEKDILKKATVFFAAETK